MTDRGASNCFYDFCVQNEIPTVPESGCYGQRAWARWLNVHERTLQRWIRELSIPVVDVGQNGYLIYASDMHEALRKKAVAGGRKRTKKAAR